MTRTIPLILLGLSLTSCAQLTDVGSKIAVGTGLLTSSQAESLKRSTEAVTKTFEDITPSQEYYLGRSVSATLLSKYSVIPHVQENRYLNLIGKMLVLSSSKPETFPNYHFLILDSEEINAFAAPSGFIFVTKGMIRLCQNEDDLAAVLAHEISHVLNSHALKAIKTSRITSALTLIGGEGIKTAANNSIVNQLMGTFEGSIDDMTQTLTNSGYGRRLESEADKTAVGLLQKSGYNAEGLVRVLERLKAKTKPGAKDFTATHPDTDDRISEVKDWLSEGTVNPVSALRTARFTRTIGRL